MEEILDTPQEAGNDHHAHLKHLLQEGYTFDFGAYFDKGFKIFGKAPWAFIGFSALRALILGFSFITIIGPLFIWGPLTAGYYIVGEKIDRGEPWEFSDFFKGFEFFLPFLGLHFLIAVILSFVYALFFLFAFGISNPLMQEDMNDFAMLIQSFSFTGAWFMMIFIMFLAMIVVTGLSNLIYPFIVNGKLGAIDAIRLSVKISAKQFWWFILFGFTVYLFEGAGAYVLYIGMLATIPLNSLIKLGAYSTIVGYGSRRDEATQL